ncbi:carbon-nitrogen hydrolase family protein [Candidatus Woesearchaeota archaeon]|nr:carbon-nitrogen hydrolase family protein [Candidatus Woesearchaeota archaeon]MCF7900978.1 carbon-nitrogen hydrolase family protein [Candidatus Woesearchaeota archaeon]MCF8013306.1 carbon-nitrogen hydrolase family protein [Candidatus Woesearchaeota archaeon]
MKVVAAQIKITDSKNENLKKILEYIKKAKSSDVICFPELSLQCNQENVLSINKDIKKICESAKEHNINVIFGAYIKINYKIKNRLFVINKKGKLIYQYNKKHPYSSEEKYLSKGRNNKPFELDGIKCAVINCWDYAFPEFGRNLAEQGAKVIFCPAYLMSFPKTKNVLKKIPQVRAFDYMSYFIMVDAVTEETFKKSKICHPLKQLKAIKDKEGMIQANLNIEEITNLRKEFKNFRTKRSLEKIDETCNIF